MEFVPSDLPFPPDAQELMFEHMLNMGRCFTEAQRVEGEVQFCHANCTSYIESHPGLRHCVGFGLYGGIWRAHSWVFDGGVLETTPIKREKYFGAPFEFMTVSARIKIYVENIDIACKTNHSIWSTLVSPFPCLGGNYYAVHQVIHGRPQL